ncbi:hypothetical protein JTB14_023038 [Gonioctena quinquepunctata]|nr:hypothetical protein JTB14_023038 [Gonioctena quinquepunctata]
MSFSLHIDTITLDRDPEAFANLRDALNGEGTLRTKRLADHKLSGIRPLQNETAAATVALPREDVDLLLPVCDEKGHKVGTVKCQAFKEALKRARGGNRDGSKSSMAVGDDDVFTEQRQTRASYVRESTPLETRDHQKETLPPLRGIIDLTQTKTTLN